jgi:hypothetical protein
MMTKKPNQITMTVQDSGEAVLKIAGSGTVTIDWGDETECIEQPLPSIPSCYTHGYTCFSSRTVTVTGSKITHLICENQGITTLDVTKDSELKELFCSDNHLTELDLSKNAALTYLSCYNNHLTSLDLSNNRALITLGCPSNKLTSLDLSKNTKLMHLFCSDNRLTGLDVSKNTRLSKFDCRENLLTGLDVGKNTVLDYLSCCANRLSSLDTGNNTGLQILFCTNNRLTHFDASRNTSLEWLILYDNQLSTDALNAMFRTLLCGNKNLISVENNSGTDGCDIAIAESNGWKVADRTYVLPDWVMFEKTYSIKEGEWAKWSYTLANAIKDFYEVYRFYPNILQASDCTYSQFDFWANASQDERQRCTHEDAVTGIKKKPDKTEKIKLTGFAYYDRANVDFTIDNKLADKEFRLIYDEEI